MAEPRWIEIEAVIALHDRSLALHGGAEGIRDRGLLESALARPLNRFSYEGVDDLAELAATYAAAVSANHPFADGNKRAAFLCLTLFLRLNGRRLTASQVDATRTILALAAGELSIEALAAWVRANLA
ncbi:MAG: type II toxin-antitoxin system death-on-curing family toxin [Caulobacteraceae bacterium]